MARIARQTFIALTVLAAAAPVAGAATWSAPTAISATHRFIRSLRVVSPSESLAGMLDASWDWQDGVAPASTAEQVSLPGGAAAFGPESVLPNDISDLQAVGEKDLIAVLQSQTHATTRTRPAVFRVGVATGRAGGLFKPEQTLAETTTNGEPQLGVSPNGKAVVSFIEFDNKTKQRKVVASIRNPSTGLFTKPAVLAGRAQAELVTAAAGDRNVLVVAWVSKRQLFARVRREGHQWGPTQRLKTVDEPTFWQIEAAVDVRGRVELVWQRTLKGSGHPSERVIEAAYQPVGSQHFHAAQVVEPSFADDLAGLVTTSTGWAVGYRVRHAGSSVITPRIRMLSPGPGATMDAGPGSHGLRDLRLASSPLQGLFATWTQPSGLRIGGTLGLGAIAPSPAPQAFGPVETITPTDTVQEIEPAFEPLTGQPIAIWISRDDGPPGEIGINNIHSVVEASTRSE